MNDINVIDSVWNNYLKKYNDNYKVQPDEINIWQIQCTYGTIQLYNLSKKELCFVGEYKSARGINFLKRTIPSFCTITQEGVCDIVIKFPESKIHELVDIFKIRKKRKLSDEHKAKLLLASEQYRFKPHTNSKSNTVVVTHTSPTTNERLVAGMFISTGFKKGQEKP